MYSLSTSFWIVPVSCVAGHALALADELVEQHQQRRRSVDRHRRRHLVERDAVEQDAHVLDRVDRDADLADLATARSGSRSRSPSGSADRTPPTGPSCRPRSAGDSAGCSPTPCRIRRTAASSTAARCTSTRRRRACRGSPPAGPAWPRDPSRRAPPGRRPARREGRTRCVPLIRSAYDGCADASGVTADRWRERSHSSRGGRIAASGDSLRGGRSRPFDRQGVEEDDGRGQHSPRDALSGP